MSPLGGRLGGRVVLAGENLREATDVVALDHRLTFLAPVLEPVDELGTQDVDLAMQDAALVGDLLLLRGQALDQLLELLVAHRADVGKGLLVHPVCSDRSGSSGLYGSEPAPQPEVEGSVARSLAS